MRHLDFIGLFEKLAREHKDIRHGNNGRSSFFRMNNEGEIIIKTNTEVTFPCLLIQNINGGYKKAGTVTNRMTGEFEIRTHIDAGDYDQEEAARDTCQRIGENIIAYLDQISEEQGSCGVIEDFDIDSVIWEYTGPININEFGCRFRFNFAKTAYNPYTINLDEYFIDESAVTLTDYDGEDLMDFDGEYLFEH